MTHNANADFSTMSITPIAENGESTEWYFHVKTTPKKKVQEALFQRKKLKKLTLFQDPLNRLIHLTQ